MSDVIENYGSLDTRLLEILRCPLCLRLPRGAVFQCGNGHLICGGCFANLAAEADQRKENAVCPTCSLGFNPHLVIRNRAVEMAVAEISVECRYCKKMYPRKVLEQHEQTFCDERTSLCRFTKIGCDWRGPTRLRTVHEEQCSLSKQLGTDFIRKLLDYDQKNKQAGTQHDSVIDLLNNECIIFYDLQLKPRNMDDAHKQNFLETGRFWAFTNRWVIRAMVSDSQKELAYQLIMKSKERSPCNINYVVLQGPFGAFKIEPRVINYVFKGENDSGPDVVLPIQEEIPSSTPLSVGPINFRIVMFLNTR